MAAGDFSALALQQMKVKLSQMFRDPNTSDTYRTNGVGAAIAILANQTANVVDRLVGNECVGVKAVFMRTSDTSQSAAFPTDCSIPTGPEAEGFDKDYATAILVHSAAKARDNRCGTDAELLGDEIAFQIDKVLADNRIKLLKSILLPRLVARAQVNLDGDIPSTWDDATDAPIVRIPKAELKWDSLADVQAMISLNNFGPYFILSGRNFFKDAANSQLLQDNDDCCKVAKAAYGDLPIYFDLRNIDSTLTYPGTFVIDRNSYIFWNARISKTTVTVTPDGEGEVWTWAQADPILEVNVNGEMMPLYHEMEMHKKCIGRNAANGTRQHQYLISARIVGGFEGAPTGPNAEKGVLLIKGV